MYKTFSFFWGGKFQGYKTECVSEWLISKPCAILHIPDQNKRKKLLERGQNASTRAFCVLKWCSDKWSGSTHINTHLRHVKPLEVISRASLQAESFLSAASRVVEATLVSNTCERFGFKLHLKDLKGAKAAVHFTPTYEHLWRPIRDLSGKDLLYFYFCFSTTCPFFLMGDMIRENWWML